LLAVEVCVELTGLRVGDPGARAAPRSLPGSVSIAHG
jgi:hypothetical protein